MEKINVAGILKGCPRGMELNCTICEDVYFDYVSELNIIHCYIQYETYRTSIIFNQYGTYNSDIKSKCVIFPKGKNTWEGFQRPFKDGDILVYKHKFNNVKYTFIYKRRIDMHYLLQYCGWFSDKLYLSEQFNAKERMPLYENDDIRFATEEEKEKLFDAIKANGYKWNPKTKTLEKLIPEFKDGDVIVFENHWGPFISIFKENVTGRNGFIGHCVLDVDDNEFKVKDSVSYFNKARFATKREKEQLFRAIENNGYKWNDKAKTLEKLASKFDINTLVPFESRVLVRNDKDSYWRPSIFGCYIKDVTMPYYVLGGTCWKHCIPYEGNEHLRGKADDCNECFKNWK